MWLPVGTMRPDETPTCQKGGPDVPITNHQLTQINWQLN